MNIIKIPKDILQNGTGDHIGKITKLFFFYKLEDI